MKLNLNLLFAVLVPLLALLIYGNTVQNEMALDDELYILKNPAIMEYSVGDGISAAFKKDALFWIDLPSNSTVYRPLLIASFVVEKAIFPIDSASGFTHPSVSHIINIIFYAGGCLLLFFFLKSLLSLFNIPVFWAGIMAVLYTVHPIHTEVVANIKSRDELMALVFGMASLWMFTKYIIEENRKWFFWSLGLYLVTLFAKESAVTLLAIFPLVYWMAKGGKENLGKTIFHALPYFGLVLFFLMVRKSAMPDTAKAFEIVDNFLIEEGTSTYYGTAFLVLMKYIKLLIIPDPLTWDYSLAQIKAVGIGNPIALLSIIVHVGLLIYGVMAAWQRKLIGFAILFYIVTLSLTSNLFITIASVMAERFVFVPSIGFVIAVVLGLKYITDKFIVNEKSQYLLSSVGVGVVTLLFSVLTFNQNKHWKNNEALFLYGVEVSDNSTRTHGGAGNIYVKKSQAVKDDPAKKAEYLKQARYHYGRAIEIHDGNINAHLGMGNAYFYEPNLSKAKEYYEKTLALNPGNNNALDNLTNLSNLYFNAKKLPEAQATTNIVAKFRPNDIRVVEQKAKYLFVQGKMAEALPLLESLARTNPTNAFYKEKVEEVKRILQQRK